MADPRNELADIIVPLAPTVAAGASDLLLWTMIASVAGAICMVLAVWWWHRRRFARSLQVITHAVDRQQGVLPEFAARLDTWARGRFRLLRLEASSCPQGIDPDVWADWVNTLTSLRFAPPPGGRDALVALCATAQQWKQHA